MQQQTIAGLALKEFMDKESRVPDDTTDLIRSDAPHITLKNVFNFVILILPQVIMILNSLSNLVIKL